MSFEVTVWNPTMDSTKYAADVYLIENGRARRRIYCGRGGHSIKEAMSEASKYIESFVAGYSETKEGESE